MNIAPGSRLGSYDVVGPLGAGGMGEVYRARDLRLGREVAIKVLPADVSEDPARLKRFEKEARAASALNHPNIVTIYDVGASDSVSWIAMERVEGKTLRELLFGALPMKKLLAIAAQIADGLSRAHEAGIVHRDLKPENVMVTKDGLVKILDFGLAKRTETGAGSDQASHLPTETATSPGMILGTVGYMSPEQAGAQPVDFRSDQFSFGSILYEMATGQRAFQKGTAVDTLSAILHDEPKPVADVNPQVPAPFGWIVERCLAKEPALRYGATRDLALDLASLRNHLLVAAEPAARNVTRAALRRRRVWLAVASVLLVSVGVLALRQARFTKPPANVPARLSRVTFRQGEVSTARFAPDGETVVYGARYEGKPSEVFSARPGIPEPRALGIVPADVLAVSRTGEMAVLLGETFNQGTLARAALAGGAPREILENVRSADWAPDDREMAVVRFGGRKNRLEYPIGKVLYEAAGFMGRPRISPDGDRIAIGTGKSILVFDRTGRRRELRVATWGVSWSPTGDELFSYENRGGTTRILATTLEGKERELLELPGEFLLHDVSRTGRLLLERGFARGEIVGLVPGQDHERSFSWLDVSRAVGLSEDGKTLLFMDTAGGGLGDDAWIYVRRTDGSQAVRLGEGSPIALSPDARWSLAVPRDSTSRLDLLPTGAGTPRSIALGSIHFGRSGCFFPDGNRILFEGFLPGGEIRLYVCDVQGGEPRPITSEGHRFGAVQPISPDGVEILSTRDNKRYLLRSNGSGTPRAVASFPDGFAALRWCADGKTVFARKGEKVYRVNVASGVQQLWKEFPGSERGELADILPTSDGRWYVLGYHRYLSDLWTVDGVK